MHLRYCPYCSETKLLSEEYQGSCPPCYTIVCDNCGLSGPFGYGNDFQDEEGAKKDAAQKWNEIYRKEFDLDLQDGWIYVTDKTVLKNGKYKIKGNDTTYDCNLKPGEIEIYDHFKKGKCYWDENTNDGTDYSGHISISRLIGLYIHLVNED